MLCEKHKATGMYRRITPITFLKVTPICDFEGGIEPTPVHNLPDKLRYRTFEASFWHRLL